jgi:acyl carrier protein
LSPGIRWLLFIKNDTKGTGFGSKLSEKLEQMGQEIIEVNMGPAFTKVSDREFIIDPQQKEDYEKLFGHLQTLERIPVKIIHLWAAAGDEDGAAVGENLNRTLDTGLFSLLNIVHAIVTRNITAPIQLGVVTTNMQEVVGGDLEYPEKSTILGAVKVIPLEYDNIDCRSIDIELPPSGSRQEDRLIRQLLEEFTLEPGDKVRVTAYRGDHRWVQLVKPIRLDKSGEVVNRFRKEGVYLITGGFGGMGFRLAQHLGEHLKARLILVGRSFFPGRSDWQSWLENQNSENPISRKIREIKALEAHGAEVMTASADVSDKTRMKEVIVQAQERFGRVNGILHTAGIADYAGVIHKRTRKMTEEVMAAKVKGTLVICDLTGDMDLDFFVLFSSLGNYIKGFNFGQVGYSAANEFLDAFAYYNNAKKETFTVTISWDGWREVGMAVEALRRGHETRGGGDDESVLSENLTPSEGVEAFNRILENKLPHIIISTRDLIMLNDRINAVNVSSRPVNENPQASEIKYSRPQLKTTYAEPESDVEKILCTIWENYLGIDRVGIHDNFFDLGANSMDITQINIKIKQTLQREISVINLYTYPTVHSLSQSLTGEENEENTKNDIEALKKERKKGKSKLQKRKSRTSDSTRA